MASSTWINWEVQVPAEDLSNQSETFCIVKDGDEFEPGVSASQYILSSDPVQVEESIPTGEWQMVRMSQVTTKQGTSAVTPTEKVKCNECNKSFSNANYLKDHMRTHTGEKPFVCEECGIAFAQKCNLRMHQRIHTGERPYMCGICAKTFNRSSHLKGHMMQHTGDKPYVCDTCGQRFTNLQCKKNHMRLHLSERPLKCEICDMKFTNKPALKMHIKSHGKEARYFCAICKRKFLFRSALFEHMTFHSKMKSYECDQCHKRFKQKQYLKKHKTEICGSKSLLPADEEAPDGSSIINDATQLKHRVLNTIRKAKPCYIDSEEEEDYYFDSEDEKDMTRRTRPLVFSQNRSLPRRPIDTSGCLDRSYNKLLKRLGLSS